jgi:hypothetical protein
MNKSTDTPRTDAATELYGERPFMTPAVPVEFAKDLERELTASKAEVEMLRGLCERAINALTHTAHPMDDEPEKLRAELLGISE